MKTKFSGVYYNSDTKKYCAKLGIQNLGQYDTIEQAAKAYNDRAKNVFTFPILNPNHVEKEEIEQVITKEESSTPPLEQKENKIEVKETIQQEDLLKSAWKLLLGETND